ncbi:hypothetical protein KC19_1G285300 [Ceratodon purpureus]|uniref:Uncharacterized protein n=1 Tax=Ceratodon purpureus TaxID=3225 RepID=A0A8T0JC23_CERPU|nr:hypothetical protein KC19_1G285300 [Ceratodon purpureus]
MSLLEVIRYRDLVVRVVAPAPARLQVSIPHFKFFLHRWGVVLLFCNSSFVGNSSCGHMDMVESVAGSTCDVSSGHLMNYLCFWAS